MTITTEASDLLFVKSQKLKVKSLMQFTRTQLIIVGIVGLIVLFFILGFLGVIPIFNSTPQGQQRVALNFWGIEPEENFRDAFALYQQTHPAVTIAYKQVSEQNYENTLLNAMATQSGPDVFMFHRSWLLKHGDKIVPADTKTLPVVEIRKNFPDIVEKDFVYQNAVYALPLYIDSLALFYNRDIFNSKGIAVAPKTWGDIKVLTPQLTEFDLSNKITKSAIALGGSDKSITNASDILSLLMFQMEGVSEDSRTNQTTIGDRSAGAVNFYLQFTNSASPYYTWSNDLQNDLDSFASGKTAMVMGYASQMDDLLKKNPFLRFEAVPAPQNSLSSPINYADYWGLAVSTQSTSTQSAWDLIISLTGATDTSLAYLKKSKMPPALRNLINQYQSDEKLSAFSKQVLTTHAFSQDDGKKFSEIMSNMVESILSGRLDIGRALEQAKAQLNTN